MISEKDAVTLLQLAVDDGINFFDTARGYGCSEARIGKAFKDRRQDVVIATKCAHLYDCNNRVLPDHELIKTVDESLTASLSALQTDYVDVYMVHNALLEILSNPVIAETFAGYRQKGAARAIGVSTNNVEETRAAIESGVWDMIQLSYNLMDQRPGELFGLAEQNGVGLVIRSVLFKGILTDRGRNLHPELKAVEQHKELYNELLSETAPNLSDLATKFVLSNKEVSSVLVGIDKPEYLQSALAVADGNYLDQDEMARARQLAYPDPEFLNLPMWDRKGWLT